MYDQFHVVVYDTDGRKSRQKSLFYRTHSSPLFSLAPFRSCGAADTAPDNPDRLLVLMDWLRKIFTGKSADEIAAKKRRKRQNKLHSQRVRAREKELRLARDGGGAKSARLFWGPPGETYSNEKRGKRPKELPTSGLMRTSHWSADSTDIITVQHHCTCYVQAYQNYRALDYLGIYCTTF